MTEINLLQEVPYNPYAGTKFISSSQFVTGCDCSTCRAAKLVHPTDGMLADLLDDAAWYIERHGWCQHTVEDATGRVCAMGAIIHAANWRYGHAEFGIASFLAELCAMKLGEEVGSTHVPSWNDSVGRTEQEVLDALRLTAKHARGVEG